MYSAAISSSPSKRQNHEKASYLLKHGHVTTATNNCNGVVAPMTSTATLQTSQHHNQRALSAQANPPRSRSSNFQSLPRSASHPHPTRQYEKEQILRNVDTARSNGTPVPAEQIPSIPEEKGSGFSSKTLKFSDFELMQTLGTGK